MQIEIAEVEMQEQTPNDTDVINANTLRTLRKRRGWSQAELAGKCGCRPEQISRWERSESSTPRYRLRTALAKALGVEWKDLTRPLPDDGRKAGDDQQETVQLNVRIDQRERNALSLVCLRYGVQPAEVVRLAPLLFLITAEKSLAWRRRNLGALDEALDKIPPLAPHLSGELAIVKGRAEEAMFTEQESLEARDIFGRRIVRGTRHLRPSSGARKHSARQPLHGLSGVPDTRPDSGNEHPARLNGNRISGRDRLHDFG